MGSRKGIIATDLKKILRIHFSLSGYQTFSILNGWANGRSSFTLFGILDVLQFEFSRAISVLFRFVFVFVQVHIFDKKLTGGGGDGL